MTEGANQKTTAEEAVEVALEVNGTVTKVLVPSRWLLSDVLRHRLGLTATHVGCEQGVCGACTVLIDGVPTRSCLLFAKAAEGLAITTLEGVLDDPALQALQEAFHRHHALQCGFCTPGMLLTALAMVRQQIPAEPETIREYLSGNLCRCTGYQYIVEAVAEVLQAVDRGDPAGSPALP